MGNHSSTMVQFEARVPDYDAPPPEDNKFHWGCQNGHKGAVEHWLMEGADINLMIQGSTPLLRCAGGYTDAPAIMEYLLEEGAKKDLMRPTEDAAAYTALHLAALLGHQGVARVLIEHGADVNALDTEGKTPLWMNGKYSEHFSTIVADRQNEILQGKAVIKELLLAAGALLDISEPNAPKAVAPDQEAVDEEVKKVQEAIDAAKARIEGLEDGAEKEQQLADMVQLEDQLASLTASDPSTEALQAAPEAVAPDPEATFAVEVVTVQAAEEAPDHDEQAAVSEEVPKSPQAPQTPVQVVETSNSMTPMDRVARLEGAMGNELGDGGVLSRLNGMETELLGAPSPGPIPGRLTLLEESMGLPTE